MCIVTTLISGFENGGVGGGKRFFFVFKSAELGVFFSHCYFGGGCGDKLSSWLGKCGRVIALPR